jgi:membrane-associated protease RseP (regulator of RpoE activity)
LLPASSPSTKSWVLFFLLLTGTLFTTYLAGGFLFSIFLVLILGTHEFGHYWASRKNNVKATLPFFIPAPPIFIAGTFGAFIQIKELIPNRRVLMEIGAAGPIAGFIVAVPTLALGLFLSEVTPVETLHGLTFGSSILLAALSKLILGVTPLSNEVNIQLHPIAFAGWIGLFVTALNLLPIGQLDGGHVLYSLSKGRYGFFSKGFFVLLFPLGYFWPGWLFWAVMIILMGFKPAPLIDDSILPDRKHRVLGYVSIIIFLLTFIPVPFAVV